MTSNCSEPRANLLDHATDRVDIVCGYRPTRVVFGCTELHLFTAAADRGELVLPFDAVDALTTLAGLICDSRAAPAIPRW